MKCDVSSFLPFSYEGARGLPPRTGAVSCLNQRSTPTRSHHVEDQRWWPPGRPSRARLQSTLPLVGRLICGPSSCPWHVIGLKLTSVSFSGRPLIHVKPRDAFGQKFEPWIMPCHLALQMCERACSLVVTRVPVAPQVLGSSRPWSEFFRI